MNELELKQAFAKMILRDVDPFEAALKLFPENTNRALRVAHEWPKCKEVLEIQNDFSVEGERIHSKEELRAEQINILRKIAKDDLCEPEERIKAAKVIGELAGLIEKPQTNINANVQNISNKVMVVKENGNDAEWEEKLLQQQKVLTNASCH